MRAFIAIELPVSVQEQVRKTQRSVQGILLARPHSNLYQWTAVEKLHLTLRFLGEIDDTQTARLTDGLRPIATQTSSFALALAGLGAFSNMRSPRILWIGLQGDLTALGHLQTRIEQLVQSCGLAPPHGSFSAHITIARAKQHAARSEMAAAGQSIQQQMADVSPTPAAFVVDEMVLMQSELLREGARYRPIERFRLDVSPDEHS
jgi:2'-5' RNA ligase